MHLRREQKEYIVKAAHIKGLTMTESIIQNPVETDRGTIRDYDAWTLEQPDAEIFEEALATPASLEPRLADAARCYKEEFLQQ